ncbi:rhodanese-like domain-containing protein [Jeotgalibacillus proteolyticus]|uniref:Rhodanese n=1 Tax=Jeotgalibacillus proteolyticus TaxID=2082395 RepID=A0A2S5GD61_9BACL|nr:rhodanese-like domain-containing protein [Jeotgalibacillus proteolyticus]PPA70940.1 rhodanese [Jeotgalibacillus proteolyticus]
MRERTPIEVEALLKKNPILILDVREAEEVAQGKIPGAIHIPLGLLEYRLNELHKDKEYTVVCRSGGRSGRAVQLLESRGYNAVNMNGGMMAWEGPAE